MSVNSPFLFQNANFSLEEYANGRYLSVNEKIFIIRVGNVGGKFDIDLYPDSILDTLIKNVENPDFQQMLFRVNSTTKQLEPISLQALDGIDLTHTENAIQFNVVAESTVQKVFVSSDTVEKEAFPEIRFIGGNGVEVSLSPNEANNRMEVTIEGTSDAPSSAAYIIREAESSLENAQNLGILGDGLLKNTVQTGVATLSIGEADTDYVSPNVSLLSLKELAPLEGRVIIGGGTTWLPLDALEEDVGKSLTIMAPGVVGWSLVDGGGAWSHFPASEDVDMSNNRITELADGEEVTDAATVGQVLEVTDFVRNLPLVTTGSVEGDNAYTDLSEEPLSVELGGTGLNNGALIDSAGYVLTVNADEDGYELKPNSGDASGWSQYPAQSDVDMGGNGLVNVSLTKGGVVAGGDGNIAQTINPDSATPGFLIYDGTSTTFAQYTTFNSIITDVTYSTDGLTEDTKVFEGNKLGLNILRPNLLLGSEKTLFRLKWSNFATIVALGSVTCTTITPPQAAIDMELRAYLVDSNLVNPTDHTVLFNAERTQKIGGGKLAGAYNIANYNLTVNLAPVTGVSSGDVTISPDFDLSDGGQYQVVFVVEKTASSLILEPYPTIRYTSEDGPLITFDKIEGGEKTAPLFIPNGLFYSDANLKLKSIEAGTAGQVVRYGAGGVPSAGSVSLSEVTIDSDLDMGNAHTIHNLSGPLLSDDGGTGLNNSDMAGKVGYVLSVASGATSFELTENAGDAAAWSQFDATQDVNANNNEITNLTAGTVSTSAANVSQVEAVDDRLSGIPVLTKSADASLTASQNLGLLSNGILNVSVSGGEATVSSQTSIPVSQGGTAITSLTGEGNKLLGVNSGGTAYEFTATLDSNRGGTGLINADMASKADYVLTVNGTEDGYVLSPNSASSADWSDHVAVSNVDMSAYKLTNLSAGTTAGDSVRYEQLEAVANDLEAAESIISNIQGQLGTAQNDIEDLQTLTANLPVDNGGTALQLSDLTGNANNVLTVNGTEDGYSVVTTKSSIAALWSTQSATTAVTMSTHKITGMGDGTSAQDAVTKSQLDGVSSTVSALDTRVGTAETNITNLQTANTTARSIATGGTGQTTASAAFGALAPVASTQSDMLYWNGSAWAVLASPSGDGTYNLTCTVSDTGSTRTLSWVTV